MIRQLQKLFSPNEREVARAEKLAKQILALEEETAKLTDEELKNSTSYFREKLGVDIAKVKSPDIYYNPEYPKIDEDKNKQERKKILALIPEVYARVREAAKRVAKHQHFKVQLMTGILLADSKIAEVFTGEGKTNSAILAAYLYGLSGKGVHVATVNDYLAKRDAEWGGQILLALGMETAVIGPNESYKIISDEEAVQVYGEDVKETLKKKDMANMSSMTGINLKVIPKKEAYMCDVVYGQANEFGFDYLRDNMAKNLEDRVQRYYYFSIVDECDSILIDEARTPLIISVPDEQPSEIYSQFAAIAEKLKSEEDYEVDEKRHSVVLTDAGIEKVEKMIGVDNIWGESRFIKHIDNALKAKALYRKDKEYIVHNDEVLIVDQFTGRVQPGRRYSEGLHQAIEAKERVPVKTESKTLATISFQNYFRMYSFLSGMTGTAMTEAEEFAKIYSLDVVRVPTHNKVVRDDMQDVIYKTEEAKFNAVVSEIKEMYEKGRPVLAGTTSIEKSEYLSKLLKKQGVPHQVLNAKQHEKEAKIVAAAGQKGTITIATNMAGRGTDIKLTSDVKELGGLHIIGTERHEARRIDNQLRGRSGRLGDPGSSKFYLSLEDHLMRVFGGDMIKTLLGSQLPEDLPLESRLLSGVIKSSQEKVESLNFDVRKRLVEYDDVLNFQRETVYKMRKLILLKFHEDVLPEFHYFDITKHKATIFLDKVLSFSLKRKADVALQSMIKDTFLDYPLRLWVLKQVFDQIVVIIGYDKKPTKKITVNSYTLLKDFLDTCIPNDLQEKVAKRLEFESYEKLLEKMASSKAKTYSVDITLLVNFLITAFYEQIDDIYKSVPQKEFERELIMSALDYLWMEHIDAMSDLREGIGFRGYAQRDPLVEYKREGTTLFKNFFGALGDMVARRIYRLKPALQNNIQNESSAVRSAVQRALGTNMVNQRNTKKKKGKK